MEIPYDKLTALVSEAFDLGVQGCADLKSQEIQDLFAKYKIQENDEFRVWTAEELKKMPEGTIFTHLLRGRCFIQSRANGSKFMQFAKGQAIDFNSNLDPWDKPMKLVSTP
jgi:hypothetical protein